MPHRVIQLAGAQQYAVLNAEDQRVSLHPTLVEALAHASLRDVADGPANAATPAAPAAEAPVPRRSRR